MLAPDPKIPLGSVALSIVGTVSKDALAALLRDHGKLIARHRHELDGPL